MEARARCPGVVPIAESVAYTMGLDTFYCSRGFADASATSSMTLFQPASATDVRRAPTSRTAHERYLNRGKLAQPEDVSELLRLSLTRFTSERQPGNLKKRAKPAVVFLRFRVSS